MFSSKFLTNIDTVIKNKFQYNNHREQMEEYNKRMGHPPNTKIFYINS